MSSKILTIEQSSCEIWHEAWGTSVMKINMSKTYTQCSWWMVESHGQQLLYQIVLNHSIQVSLLIPGQVWAPLLWSSCYSEIWELHQIQSVAQTEVDLQAASVLLTRTEGMGTWEKKEETGWVKMLSLFLITDNSDSDLGLHWICLETEHITASEFICIAAMIHIPVWRVII